MEAAALLLLGLGTGVYGAIVGVGGGFVLVPALILLFDMEPTSAAGTSVALVTVNSLSGSEAYRRMGIIDYRSGLLFAGAAIPGAVTAPFVLRSVPSDTFDILLGALLMALAAYMILQPRPAASAHRRIGAGGLFRTTRRIVTPGGAEYRYSFNEMLAVSLNLLLGFMSSFFGTGGGFLRTPILIRFFGFPVLVAVATSIFALVFYTAAGAVTHAALGHIDLYPTLVWSGVGLVGGAQAGVRVADRIGALWVMRLLLALVLVMGAALLFEGIAGSRG